MPTSEWNAATSSGMAVIGTRRAITAPTLPPAAMPTSTSSQAPTPAGGWEASVVPIAIAMPIMPNRLPCRLVSGLDSPRSARMKRTPATRYSSATRLAFIALRSRGSNELGGLPLPNGERVGVRGRVTLDRFVPPHPDRCAIRPLPRGERWSKRHSLVSSPTSSSSLLLLVHRQHALGDEEAAEDVD